GSSTESAKSNSAPLISKLPKKIQDAGAPAVSRIVVGGGVSQVPGQPWVMVVRPGLLRGRRGCVRRLCPGR
ncbi:hypothetical protein AB0885_44340, partial [Streptomyces sp. NPDC005534]